MYTSVVRRSLTVFVLTSALAVEAAFSAPPRDLSSSAGASLKEPARRANGQPQMGSTPEVHNITQSTSHLSIQLAVDAAAPGDVLEAEDGTFVENVVINKDITLRSMNGRANTTIEGISGVGALGTVVLTGGTTGVVLGGAGQGFTIQGIDNNAPGIENAAVYLQGGHANTQIIDNEIVANGDGGLSGEFGEANTGLVISQNTFSGTTFLGPEPADNGFDNQFITPNVPRQLVVLGGGTGGGNTSNITFTNNIISGTAGGTNAGGEQGNTLVTIDSVGATITGNTFAGSTTGIGSSFRARGTNTVISGNNFDGTGQTPTANYMLLANPGTANDLSTDPASLADVTLANSFTPGAAYIQGHDTIFIGTTIQGFVNNLGVPNGVTLRFTGTYAENVDVNRALTIGGTPTITGTLTLSAVGATLDAGFSPGIIVSGDLTLTAGSSLNVEANGLTPGTDHDQYQVTGAVSLGGATLNAFGTITSSPGDQVVFISNDGADAVSGTFAGLAQGAALTLNSETYRIFYNGGDGNDVVLIRAVSPLLTAYVDDDFAGTTPGADPDGGDPAQFFGIDSFASIKDAVNAVASGATIHVASGAYVESGQIHVTSDLDVLGHASPRPVVMTDSDTGSGGNARGWWLVDAGAVLNVANMEFDGTGHLIWQAFRQQGSGSFANCAFREIKFNASGPDYAGTAIAAFGDGITDVIDCEFQEIGRIGLHYFGSGVNGSTATGLTYTGKGVGNFLDYGVELGGGAQASVIACQVTDCRGVAASDNSASAGILASTFFGAGTALSLENSAITGNTLGVAVGFDSTDTAAATIFNNDLSTNDSGSVSNTSATVVTDASGNWHGSNVAATVAAGIDGAVDYTPWLDGGSDTDLVTAGFQGSFATLWVDDDSTQTGAVGRVQEGVNLVDGSIVNVLPGTYEEQVEIDSDNLELVGAGDGTNPLVDTIIQSPPLLTYSFATPGNTNKPVIGVHDAAAVSIRDLRVDGLGRGNANHRFIGVAYVNADGDVDGVTIASIRNTPLDGTQHGVGLYVISDDSAPRTVNVSDVHVTDYQKNATVFAGEGLSVHVQGGSFVGAGPLANIAQNGLQYSGGAGGSIVGATIGSHQYTPLTVFPAGILAFENASLDIADCDISENASGIFIIDGNADIDNVSVTNSGAPGTSDAVDLLATIPLPFGLTAPEGALRMAQPFDAGPVSDGDEADPRGGATMTVTIDGSILSGSDAAGSAGVFAGTYGADLDVTIKASTVNDWDVGVWTDEDTGLLQVSASDNCIVGSVTNGFIASGPTVQQATGNYWGAESGPLDAIGNDEAGNPPCFPAATIVNADGAGNAVTEFVEYCPWLGGKATLELVVDSSCPDDAFPGQPGYQVVVELRMRDLLAPATGYQAFVDFDDAILNYRGDLSAYTNSPYPGHIGLIGAAQSGPGRLELNGFDAFNGPGTTADSLLATLVFDVDAGGECMSTAFSFATDSLASELSFEGLPLITDVVDSSTVTLDDTAPVASAGSILGCYDSQAAAEAAAIAATSASDNCTIPASLIKTANTVGDCAAVITVTVTDECGNSADVMFNTRIDDTPPTALPAPSIAPCYPTVAAANAAALAAVEAVAADNCTDPEDLVIGIAPPPAGACDTTVIVFVSDQCSNALFIFFDTRVDGTDPVVTAGSIAPCYPDVASAEAAALAATTVSDNCPGAVDVTVDTVGTCSAVVTVTATDFCGNSDFVAYNTRIDNTPPVVTCSDNTVPADAGGCDATLPLAATASDDCDGVIPPASISFTIDVDNNGIGVGADTVVNGAGTPFTFPAGTTLVRASTSDFCGNGSFCDYSVTVTAENLVNLTVVLDAVDALPFGPGGVDRNIRFVAKDGTDCADEVCEVVNFTGNPASASVQISLPCGPWTQICVKDDQHTLFETVALLISGTEFDGATDAELRSGDTDNDSDVDINDVTLFISQFGQVSGALNACPFDGVRDSDFSLNGAIAGEDFTILQLNWLEFTTCTCLPPFVQNPADSPIADDVIANDKVRTRVRVDSVDPNIALRSDLNGDGELDYRDVEIFETQNGFAPTISRGLKQIETERNRLRR